ncbi:hypothetical protein [Hymenobacter ruricola]|uniref:Uncharacterized protein n=1 Tax=Hymenobacter ruricola TaxID=2791023 RepID=A0ABS0I7R4_9BACT|nr:hypothetical protein [Hymenobacter ruricola]MBF9222602.1 hypothetical protein [Hymenobacter ruricola]
MLAAYLRRFQKLRVARTARHGEAPYKPALPLAVLDGIADGSIRDNRIEITPELIAAFTAICTDLSTGSHFTATHGSRPLAREGAAKNCCTELPGAPRAA